MDDFEFFNSLEESFDDVLVDELELMSVTETTDYINNPLDDFLLLHSDI